MTGKPGTLQSIGSQRIRLDSVTNNNSNIMENLTPVRDKGCRVRALRKAQLFLGVFWSSSGAW